MKQLFLWLLLSMMLQNCTHDSENKTKPQKRIIEPNAFYNFKMGMSIKDYKSNLYDLYKNDSVGFGWFLYTYKSEDSIRRKPMQDLYIRMNLPFKHEPKWRLLYSFTNNSLSFITLIGEAMQPDNDRSFIKYVNEKFNIVLVKKSDSLYVYDDTKTRTRIEVTFYIHRTELMIYDLIASDRIHHVAQFSPNMIDGSEDGDVWEIFYYKFNNILHEEILDTIYYDPAFKIEDDISLDTII